MKAKQLFISLTLGLGLTLALLWLLDSGPSPLLRAGVAQAQSGTGVIRVAIAGSDTPGCGSEASPCRTVQYAVDQAQEGEKILVASGVYTGVQNVPSLNTGTFFATQVVVITKSVTIRGGYTTTDWTTFDPLANPTTLDAQGQGRVLFITGDINPTVEGLRITDGDAGGLGGAPGGDDAGGGMYVITATAAISDNQVFNNTADYGGGLYLNGSTATLSANTIRDNTANDSGGGLYLDSSDAPLSANAIRDNTANGTSWWNGGGGLFLDSSDATLTNTVVADNQANNAGNGLYIWASSPRLLHTTIARNSGGNGSGVYFIDLSGNRSVALTNTILVSHTVGIAVTAGKATLEGTLWGSGEWANGADTSGAGTIITGTRNYWGNPAFVDPPAGDYHIGLGSAAIDIGVDAGVTVDIDGESRPADTGYDLGADEFLPKLSVSKEAHPDPVHSGAQLTYTLHVTNTGHMYLHATITDILPAHVTLADTPIWAGVIITPGNAWTQPVVVTVETGYAGTLTNVVEVTTDEGATGVYSETSTSVNCFARLNDEPTLYTAVQAAVDASTQPTDVVKVAGYCAGVETRAGVTQTVYISKTLTVRGGYTTTNWTTSDPVANPTTLDAQRQGRVLYITGDISPTVEGLRITSGDADGLGGDPWEGNDAGGGMYVITAKATLSNNQVFSNTAEYGGGVYVITATAILSNSQMFSNTANEGGGGLCLSRSNATFSRNTISDNTGTTCGGLLLSRSDATLISNTITSNTSQIGNGGGLCLSHGDTTLISNTVSTNYAQTSGGGLYLLSSNAAFTANIFTANDADTGGGLHLEDGDVTLNANTVISNTAFRGGGLFLDQSDATFIANTIISNIASGTLEPRGRGGGLHLWDSNVILTNTVIADNQADTAGSGLYIADSSPRLLHTTIARNSGGDGSGVYVTDSSTVSLTNTILVSHTVGISVMGGNTVAVNGILWYGTPITVSQAATATVSVQNQHQGDPAFAADGYHLTAGSAAIDQGLDVGVTVDIDGQSRPAGAGYDLGADEFPAALKVTKEPDQMVVNDFDATFTITITNTGYMDLTTVTVSDTLADDCERTFASLGVGISTTYTCTRPRVTADFTNTVTVTGTSPAGTVTDTDTALVDVITPTIEIVKSPDSQPVQSGDAVTFTISIINTGDVTLTTVTISDTLATNCDANLGSLVPTESITYTCTRLDVTADFTNTVIVTGTPPVGDVVTDTDTAFVHIITPTIEIVKSPDSQPVQSGDAVTFTITVANTSDVTLTTVTISDTLAADDCERTFASLDVEASESYTCTVIGVMTDFTNTVIVTGTPPVGDVVTDTDTAFVYIITPTIEIVKSPDSQPAQSGGTVTFTISLTNTGDVSLRPITVTDALAPDCNWTGSLTVENGISYTCVVTDVTMAFTNTAMVTGTPPVGDVVTDTDTAFIYIASPAIEIVKSPDSQPVQSHGTVTFTISVTNTGNVTLTTVTVSDTLAADECERTFASLGVEASESYTCTVTDVMTDFTNTVIVTGTPPVGDVVTDTDTATVTVEEAVAGLEATNDSPTPLDSVTTLTATITAGTNVVYTWAFGHDGVTGSGAVVAHTYPAVGVYTAIVTASNSVSVLTATTTVTITDVLIEGLEATNDSPTPLGQATTLTATITSGSNVVYTWAFGHDGVTGSGAVVAHTYPATGTYTVIVTASNPINVLTATTTVTIVEVPVYNIYLPIILKNYTPPTAPPTATPTSTSPLPTATPTPTSSPPPDGPDLVVTDISVVPNPPEAGQSATVYVTVKNQGNRPVAYGNNFYVDFYIKVPPSIPPQHLEYGDLEWGVQGSWFGVGESRTLEGSYTFTEGIYDLYAQADTDDTVVETNEDNNVLGPVSLNVTSLGGSEAPVGPAVIPTPGVGSPRPTPTLEP